jgi:hypothetical protein
MPAAVQGRFPINFGGQNVVSPITGRSFSIGGIELQSFSFLPPLLNAEDIQEAGLISCSELRGLNVLSGTRLLRGVPAAVQGKFSMNFSGQSVVGPVTRRNFSIEGIRLQSFPFLLLPLLNAEDMQDAGLVNFFELRGLDVLSGTRLFRNRLTAVQGKFPILPLPLYTNTKVVLYGLNTDREINGLEEQQMAQVQKADKFLMNLENDNAAESREIKCLQEGVIELNEMAAQDAQQRSAKNLIDGSLEVNTLQNQTAGSSGKSKIGEEKEFSLLIVKSIYGFIISSVIISKIFIELEKLLNKTDIDNEKYYCNVKPLSFVSRITHIFHNIKFTW